MDILSWGKTHVSCETFLAWNSSFTDIAGTHLQPFDIFSLWASSGRGTTAVSWRVAKQVGQEENVRGVAPAVREESGKTSRGPGQGITSITGWKEEGHN